MLTIPRLDPCPNQPAQVAAHLRRTVNLPALTVSTRGRTLAISWVGGPAQAPVFAAFAEFATCLNGTLGWCRIVRLYPVDVFGAAMLAGWDGSPDWRPMREVWSRLDSLDLTTSPFSEQQLLQGRALAAFAAVPSGAVVGWGRRRWDVAMWRTLLRLGTGVLEAVCTPVA